MSFFSRERFDNIIKFSKLLRVEPYLFLLVFQFSLKLAASHQLVQDKICLSWHHQSIEYCKQLPQLREKSSGFKSMILADSAIFGTYHTFISTIPALIWSLFVGAWVDRYVKARKTLMLFSVCSAIIENLMAIYLTVNFDANVYLNLLLHLPSSVFGGHIVARIAITHYMTSTTPSKLMSMRLAVFEMCFYVANPLGESLGGNILVRDPVFKTGEIRNYTIIYLIALGFELIALFWIVFMVNEEIARKQEMEIEMKIQGIDATLSHRPIKLKSDMKKEDQNKHPIKLLFDLENVKTMITTCLKKRPNKGRTQLFLNFASLLIIIMAFSGSRHISGMFIQKIYFWAPDQSSYMHSLDMVIHSVATLTIVPFLIRVVGVSDIPLCIIGFISFYVRNVLVGTWLDARAYYISMAITSIGGLSLIGARSHLTKIVDKDEIGKAMSFMSVLDTLAPLFSMAIFPVIFKYTIDTYPGLVYHLTAFLILIAIIMMMWIDVYAFQPKPNKSKLKSADQYDQTKCDQVKCESQIKVNQSNNCDNNEDKNSIINTEFFKRRSSVIDEFDNINISRISLIQSQTILK